MHSLSAPEGSRSPVNCRVVTSGGFRRTHFLVFSSSGDLCFLAHSLVLLVEELAKVPWAEGESSSVHSALLVGDLLHGTCSVRRDSCENYDMEGQSGGAPQDTASISKKFP